MNNYNRYGIMRYNKFNQEGIMLLDGKRKCKRFPVDLTGEFKMVAGALDYAVCQIKDFSRYGCRLIAQTINPCAEPAIELKLKMPNQEGFIAVWGDVIWSQETNGAWHAGIRFRDISASAKWDILEYAYEYWRQQQTASL